jgi:hypothetical protein
MARFVRVDKDRASYMALGPERIRTPLFLLTRLRDYTYLLSWRGEHVHMKFPLESTYAITRMVSDTASVVTCKTPEIARRSMRDTLWTLFCFKSKIFDIP